jgi:hypothetical protein
LRHVLDSLADLLKRVVLEQRANLAVVAVLLVQILRIHPEVRDISIYAV